jgi:hypothetical protein
VNIIDSSGNYAFVPGTRTLQQSDHPVFEARIEVALGQNTWPYAPNAGHTLARFQNEGQSDDKVEEFQKELLYYLDGYGPDVVDLLVERGGVSIDLNISEDALNAVL